VYNREGQKLELLEQIEGPGEQDERMELYFVFIRESGLILARTLASSSAPRRLIKQEKKGCCPEAWGILPFS
jgi:hypothetical protein